MDLGLPDGIVQILPFNPAWNESFTAERERLKLAIGAQVVDIQHIGSTSIPSMPSKPVLDIGIAVVDFESAKDYIDPVVGLGYKYLGEYGILPDLQAGIDDPGLSPEAREDLLGIVLNRR